MLNGLVAPSLVKAQDVLEDSNMEPISCDNIELLKDVTDDLDAEAARNPAARELRNLLTNPHIRSLVLAHDDIAAKNYEELPEPLPAFYPPAQAFAAPTTDAIRMVGIRKNPDEPLGITVRKESEGLYIARIMTGSMIERQGLLHVGDTIKEINGQEVNDPDQLQDILRKSSGSLTLKILPGFNEQNAFSEASCTLSVFLRAHFAYDPKRDNLIPCRDAGLPFRERDILQIVNMDDQNWWQAKKVGGDNPCGLIPSQYLEEKRKAFVKPEYDYTHKSLLCGIMTKKKRKLMYQSRYNNKFDRNDLLIYEEVARMPPFQRKTLILIGAQGVGRRTLKRRLLKADPQRFGQVIPHSSRQIRPDETDGDEYWFISPEEFETAIQAGKFLEYGDFEGNYYGSKADSVRKTIRSGKMCILDLNPTALKEVKTSEFMPYVVFIAAPPVEIMRNMHEFARQRGKTDKIRTERDFRETLDESKRIERMYRQHFDLTIVNDNFEETYGKLRRAIETLSMEPQWVPVSWVY
ncbi:hypothetical protein CAPTEDRAFT_181775 [Capitella teleta]|uniref:MAGUK p55 subfamily member 6 n=1 Tax=Capitella teleta TaxID=283909 RepID=R7VIM5_CAPTE|nr:hypothetical protein CAPTEDRAFT_181775 [Capitella teleta]|eukprot:ELU18407.1 hypothetical protein CAPTEDRAFT_181775 [Capitella teleta]